MFDRPHQRAATAVFLIFAMGLTLSMRSTAAANDSPLQLSPLTTEAETPAEREAQPLPVPDQERQSLPGDGRSPGGAGTEGSWVLRTLSALGVVLALIFVMRAVLMRLSGTQVGVGGGRMVEVLARTTIGHKAQVVFLKIHDRVIVVAHTPAGMSTLTELNEPEDVAWVLGEVEAAKPMSISQSFRTVMQRFDKDYASNAATGSDTSEQYVDRTRDQVSGLLARIRHLKDRES